MAETENPNNPLQKVVTTRSRSEKNHPFYQYLPTLVTRVRVSQLRSHSFGQFLTSG